VSSTKIDPIVGGGPENNNSAVATRLESIPLKKLIAGGDLTYSNSLIEAVNKILKYRYLFRGPMHDGTVFDKEDHRERISPAGIERRLNNHRSCPPCEAI